MYYRNKSILTCCTVSFTTREWRFSFKKTLSSKIISYGFLMEQSLWNANADSENRKFNTIRNVLWQSDAILTLHHSDCNNRQPCNVVDVFSFFIINRFMWLTNLTKRKGHATTGYYLLYASRIVSKVIAIPATWRDNANSSIMQFARSRLN